MLLLVKHFREIHELNSYFLGRYWFDASTAEDMTQILDVLGKEMTLAKFHG